MYCLDSTCNGMGVQQKTILINHKGPCTRGKISLVLKKLVRFEWKSFELRLYIADGRLRSLNAAKLHPDRTYYYRKHVDVDRLIEQCTRKVSGDVSGS